MLKKKIKEKEKREKKMVSCCGLPKEFAPSLTGAIIGAFGAMMLVFPELVWKCVVTSKGTAFASADLQYVHTFRAFGVCLAALGVAVAGLNAATATLVFGSGAIYVASTYGGWVFSNIPLLLGVLMVLIGAHNLCCNCDQQQQKQQGGEESSVAKTNKGRK